MGKKESGRWEEMYGFVKGERERGGCAGWGVGYGVRAMGRAVEGDNQASKEIVERDVLQAAQARSGFPTESKGQKCGRHGRAD